jgi:hypothetical protein
MRLVSRISNLALGIVAATFVAVPMTLSAQIIHPRPYPYPPTYPHASNPFSEDDRSGVRLGLAYLIGGSVTAEREGKKIAPLMTLFGFQLEHQFDPGKKDIPVPMTELIGLAGGMEQGRFLPSLSWMVGLRQTNGWEAAIGPTITGAGLQLAMGAGVTHSYGKLNVPMNLALAPGRRGASISFTTGFNYRHGS